MITFFTSVLCTPARSATWGKAATAGSTAAGSTTLGQSGACRSSGTSAARTCWDMPKQNLPPCRTLQTACATGRTAVLQPS
jgi:hypothetical protein